MYPKNVADESTINVGGLKLVVMEYVDGVTGHDAYGNATTLPDVILKEIEKAIALLHENGLVFGDLRPPNIMVSEERARLVDFDWCARDGVGMYPASLNDVDRDIGWHPDVKRGDVMDKKNMTFSCCRNCTALSLSEFSYRDCQESSVLVLIIPLLYM